MVRYTKQDSTVLTKCKYKFSLHATCSCQKVVSTKFQSPFPPHFFPPPPPPQPPPPHTHTSFSPTLSITYNMLTFLLEMKAHCFVQFSHSKVDTTLAAQWSEPWSHPFTAVGWSKPKRLQCWLNLDKPFDHKLQIKNKTDNQSACQPDLIRLLQPVELVHYLTRPQDNSCPPSPSSLPLLLLPPQYTNSLRFLSSSSSCWVADWPSAFWWVLARPSLCRDCFAAAVKEATARHKEGCTIIQKKTHTVHRNIPHQMHVG